MFWELSTLTLEKTGVHSDKSVLVLAKEVLLMERKESEGVAEKIYLGK